MSIGYDNVTVHDFNSYFGGGYAWEYEPDTGSVHVYRIDRINEEDEEADYSDGFAVDQSVFVNPINSAVLPEGKWVAVDDLFNSALWVVHRFPVMYATHDDVHLSCVSFEPMQRRMLKSMSRHHFRIESLVDGSDRTSQPISADLAALAICKVLEYGHHGLFSGAYSTRKRDARTDLLMSLKTKGVNGVRCIVPQAWLAFVLDADGDYFHVFRNRAIVGRLSLKNTGEPVLHTSYANTIEGEDKQEMALRGLQSSISDIIGNVAIVQEKGK